MKTIIFCASWMALAVIWSATGCGDDETTSSSAPASVASVTSVTASVSTTGSGGGGAGGGEGGAGGGEGGGSSSACLPADVLSTINAHVLDLYGTTGFTAGHPSAGEAVGFYLFPGLPAPPAVTAEFMSLLPPGCTAAQLFSPFCQEDRCSQFECTGVGAGWLVHYYLDPPQLNAADWSFATADLDVSWLDGATGITFAMSLEATGPLNRNWEMTGTGSMDMGVLEVVETFSLLLPEGSATMTYNADPNTASGTIELGGVDIAVVNSSTHVFIATGDCP